MKRVSIAAILVALACVLAAFGAAAHKASDSYLALRVEGSTLTGQWDIALRDLDLAIGLDADGDGAITWGEVRARHAQIARHALDRLSITGANGACTLQAREHLVDEHTDGAYAVLRFDSACPGIARALAIEYGLLFERDALHRGLLRLEAFGGVRSAIFSPEDRSRRFEAAPGEDVTGFAEFVADGVKHIAIGADHILFLVALLLPAVMTRKGRAWEPTGSLHATLWNVVGIVSAFTAAHSITLSLAALEIVRLPSRLVESAIALSVVATALDNIVPFLPRRRSLVAFAFGLVHGLGFAAVLIDLKLPPAGLVVSLLGFNLGVELGQLVLVAVLVPLAHLARGRREYPRYVLGAGSAAIVLVALGWVVERAF